jgi:hypothetical protein
MPYIGEIIGTHQCGFGIIDQLLIRGYALVRYGRKTVVIDLLDIYKSFSQEGNTIQQSH